MTFGETLTAAVLALICLLTGRNLRSGAEREKRTWGMEGGREEAVARRLSAMGLLCYAMGLLSVLLVALHHLTKAPALAWSYYAVILLGAAALLLWRLLLYRGLPET